MYTYNMLIQFLFHMIINYMTFQNMTYIFWYHLNGCMIHLIHKTSPKEELYLPLIILKCVHSPLFLLF